MSVQFVQSWYKATPGNHFSDLSVTVPSGYPDTLLIACSVGSTSNYVEDFLYDGVGFSEFSPQYVSGGIRLNAEYMLNPTPGTKTWRSIWYADNPVGFQALLMFSGVDQAAPFGTSDTQAETTDSLLLSPSGVEIGDLCLGIFGRYLDPANPDTITPGDDITVLFDEYNTAGTYQLILPAKNPSFSDPEIVDMYSDQSLSTSGFGISIHPTTVDNVGGNSQCVVVM